MNSIFPFSVRPELTAPFSNNDDEPRERVFVGCFSLLITFVIAFIFLVAITLLCGCSSQKSVTNVTHESLDSVTTVHIDSARHVVASSDLSTSVSLDSVHQENTLDGTLSCTETLTENITETIDSSGNHVINTSRVVERTTSQYFHVDNVYWENIRKDCYNNSLYLMDSIVLQQDSSDEVYYNRIDSVSSEKQICSSSPLSWWQRLKSWLGGVVLILSIFISAYIIMYKKNIFR